MNNRMNHLPITWGKVGKIDSHLNVQKNLHKNKKCLLDSYSWLICASYIEHVKPISKHEKDKQQSRKHTFWWCRLVEQIIREDTEGVAMIHGHSIQRDLNV